MGASAGKIVPRLRGEYDANATYLIFDQVSYGVNSYALKVATATGILPTNTDYWVVVAKGISNISPEALGIGYGISSDSGSARTATLSNYSLTPNGIVAVTFAADVQAGATLNINSQGAKPIYFRGSAIVANVIKGGDTVTFAYDGTHYDILCIDGGAGHKILKADGTELPQRDALQASDGLEFVDDSTNQRTKVKMNLPIVPFADWNAMTEQEQEAYKASHYRFGVELPDTSGVINAEYMKLLWENPNTTQAFAAQTITLNSADYDFLFIVSRLANNNDTVLSSWIPKSTSVTGVSLFTTGDNIRWMRTFTLPDFTHIDFATGYAGSTADATKCIPVAIYGIKKDFQFKVNAIADTLSTRADHCFLDDEVTTVEDAITYKDVYSTDEHVVGKWIDGSTLYEKTVVCGALTNAGWTVKAHGISNLKDVIYIGGTAIASTNTIPLPYTRTDNVIYQVRVYVNGGNIEIGTGADMTAYTKTYVTLRYTKTS